MEGTRIPDAFSKVLERHNVDFGVTDNGFPREPPRIPLCRMKNMEVVCSLQVQLGAIKNLQAKFRTNGYVEDLSKFYVSMTNADGVEEFVTEDQSASWDDIWKRQDAEFEAECARAPEFEELSNWMFLVFDGNHRLYSWLLVRMEHPDVEKFHPRVIGRFLRAKREAMIEIESTMHELNKYILLSFLYSWLLLTYLWLLLTAFVVVVLAFTKSYRMLTFHS